MSIQNILNQAYLQNHSLTKFQVQGPLEMFFQATGVIILSRLLNMGMQENTGLRQ